MGVYIKDIEMPKSPVLFCIHPDGKVFADIEGNWREYKAIAVPPHGRLIDADANLSVMRRVLDNPYTDHGKIDTAMIKTCIKMFEEAPAIIPATNKE